MARASLFRRHLALPADHGSWSFFLGPLAIGLFAGGRWHTTVLYLTVASACGFLIRQPITLVIKVLAGRRSRDTLAGAWFWIALYGGVGLLHVTGLVFRGLGYLLYLAIPGVLVFGWYLALLFRREERRQRLLEVLACGVMALVAPAGLWAGVGFRDPAGWILWALVWGQSATAILHVYMRLEQRPLRSAPGAGRRLRMAMAPLLMASASLGLAAVLGARGAVPTWLWIPFLVQWLEVVHGTWRPGVGLKPTAIGVRQLAVSIAFTVLFVLTWTAG